MGNIDPAAQDAVPALIEALSHWHMSVRAQAARTLGQIGDPDAVEALVEVMKKDKNPKVRRHAVMALGKIGASNVAPALIEALKDENQYVRFHAARALNGDLNERGS